MPLRITNWNVNGIRNPFGYKPWSENRTYQAMFDTLEADIVVMQETKIQRKDLRDDMVLVPGWDVYFSLPRHKKGYSGVAIYVRTSKCCPIRAEEGLTGVLTAPNSTIRFCDLPPDQQIGGYPQPNQLISAIDELTLDSEGRCVILEFPAFVLMGIYSPAKTSPPKGGAVRTDPDGNDLPAEQARADYRHAFMEALDVRIRNLVAAGKQVVVTGDLNVSSSVRDSAGVMDAINQAGATMADWLCEPTRRIFNQLVFGGEVPGGRRDQDREQPVMWDLCRDFNPDREAMYTCWETKRNLRPANYGSRIDYVLCSPGIRTWFTDAGIQEGLMGSDHCPVYGVLADKVVVSGDDEVDLVDLMNPDGMASNGVRLREWTQKDALPSSARLIPEFDRRRSIRDMFMKKASSTALPTATVTTPDSSRQTASTPGACTPTTPLLRSATVSASTGATPSASDEPSQASAVSSPTRKQLPKRTTDSIAASSRPSKKAKPTIEAKKKPDPSQTTLKGFFMPRPIQRPPPSLLEDCVRDQSTPSSQDQPAEPTKNDPAPAFADGPADVVTEKDQDADRVFDPIENKESWSRLLGKRVVPRCEHGEPCISLATKKPGVNNGRSFFICPRPLGPSGDKEKGTEWRCGTFVWSSDWSRGQARGS